MLALEGALQNANRTDPHHRHGHNLGNNVSIKTSNLNRQFLFKPSDKGKSKALTAKESIHKLNPLLNL